MTRLRSPIFWFGGKGNMAAKLLPILEAIPHRRYVEPFGGGASLLCAKRPAEVEVYNDLDGGLVGFFRVLADEEQFARLVRKCQATPYARAIYNDCRDTWENQGDPVERAYRWYVVARMSFSGNFGQSWGSAVTYSSRGMAATCSGWLSAIAMLPALHARWMRVQIEQADWRVILDRYDTPETLFYLDPPYVPATRRQGSYAHELTATDHADLVAALLKLQGHAVLSGYPSPVYDPLLAAGWTYRTWETVCHAERITKANKIQGDGAALAHQARTEAAWISPHASGQPSLFD